METLSLTNDFHAPFKCFVVRLGPNKCWEEGVVDVDGVSGMAAAEPLRKDLHVPAQSPAVSHVHPPIRL